MLHNIPEKRFWTVAVICSLLFAVVGYYVLNKNSNPSNRRGTPKGELAFLAAYHGRLPEDVGFLTNHIMQRRIANIIKDKMDLVEFRKYTHHGDTIRVHHNILSAYFTCDSTLPADCSSVIVVDLISETVFLTLSAGGKTSVFSDGYVETQYTKAATKHR